MSASIENPVLAPPPVEVPLAHAPLVRVIAQVRFPLIIAVEQRDSVAAFQEAVRGKYPVLRQEEAQGIVISKEGVSHTPSRTVWRFSDLEGNWRISLAQDFLAIETTRYENRADFLERLREALTALDSHIKPKLIDRLGIRYIDRIRGESIREIARLVRPEVLGVAGVLPQINVVHAITESLLTADGGQVLARWGQLPPGGTTDPSAIEPVDEASWILDLDMFTANPEAFSVDNLMANATRFAERIYTFFRWVVTDEFLRRYGGEP